MVIRELFAKLGIQVDEAAFKAADAAVGAVKSGLMGIGVAVGAARVALAGMVKATADYASEVHDLSITTGISAENLQVLGYAGKLAGVEMEEVAHGLMHLSRTAYEASTSGGAAGEAFYRLGISAYDAAGKIKEPNQLLTEVAAALGKVQNPTERAALSMQLMGRSGARLTQTLTKFGGDLEAVKKEAVSLGIVLDDKTIKAGDELGDTLDRVNFAIKGVIYAIGTPLLTRVRAMAEGWVHWISVHRQWIALRVHEAIGHVNNAMEGLYLVGRKIVEHPTLLKWLIGVGAAAAAVMFPLTALSLLIAGLAEDLALYFKNPKADTLTGALVDGFKKLKTEISGEWELFKEDPFAKLREWATKFFKWFEKEFGARIKQAIANVTGVQPLDIRPDSEQGVPHETATESGPGGPYAVRPGGFLRNAFDYIVGERPAWTQPAIMASAADGSYGRGLGVLAPQFNFSPIINVEAAPGVDGGKVGNDIWDALEPRADEWLGRKLSEAQGATHR